MKYIVCEKPGTLVIREKEPPAKLPGEALIRVRKVGICGTDLHAFNGRQPYFTYPRILGHEIAADIAEIDGGHNFTTGQSVVVLPYISCQTCIACRKGKTNCCTAIQVLGVHTDGALQELISVPVDLLIPTGGLSYSQLSVVEPLSIGAHAIRRAGIQKGDTILVMGCGPIGLGIQFLARQSGARVVAVDTNANRLRLAKASFGADEVLLAGDNTSEQLREITSGAMAEVVFDATGSRQALESGPDFMAHGGTYVLVGLSPGELSFNHPKIHARETTIMCSRNATREDFAYVMNVLKKDLFPLDSYITDEVPFTEMVSRFEQWADPTSGTIKASVDF